MKHDMDEWLKQKIDQDLMDMADERERFLMESEEFQDINTPIERLDDLHKALEAERHSVCRLHVRRRVLLAVAAIAVLTIGMGVATSGKKLYVPQIFRKEVGDEVSTKIENSDSVYREFDEEEICQEIKEKLGVVPVRLVYRPEDLVLEDYILYSETNEVRLIYQKDDKFLYIYISAGYSDTSISFKMDGEVPGGKVLDTVILEKYNLEIPVIGYQNNDTEQSFEGAFEYLNTYYRISGMIEQDEFIKMLENIALENI